MLIGNEEYESGATVSSDDQGGFQPASLQNVDFSWLRGLLCDFVAT